MAVLYSTHFNCSDCSYTSDYVHEDQGTPPTDEAQAHHDWQTSTTGHTVNAAGTTQVAA